MKPKPDLVEFWNLENIGIKDNPKQLVQKRAINIFKETLRFKYNRYSVTWPWESDDIALLTNRQLAFGRLKSLIHRNKHNLIKQYESVIKD